MTDDKAQKTMQATGDVSREICLLKSEDAKRDWLMVHRPDREWEQPFEELEATGSGLYYVGLQIVVRELLDRAADVNAHGGLYAAGNIMWRPREGGVDADGRRSGRECSRIGVQDTGVLPKCEM